MKNSVFIICLTISSTVFAATGKIYEFQGNIQVGKNTRFTHLSQYDGEDDLLIKQYDYTEKDIAEQASGGEGTVAEMKKSLRAFRIECFLFHDVRASDRTILKGSQFELISQNYFESPQTTEEKIAFIESNWWNYDGWITDVESQSRVHFTIKSRKTDQVYVISCMAMRPSESQENLIEAFTEMKAFQLTNDF